jgi:hypothetical protein
LTRVMQKTLLAARRASTGRANKERANKGRANKDRDVHRWSRCAAAVLGLMAVAACSSAVGDGASAPGAPVTQGVPLVHDAGMKTITVIKHDVHEQCPFNIAHPSVQWVTLGSAWAQMLAQARVLPPPYEAAQTDFSSQSIMIVALAATAQPAKITLDGREALRYHGGREQRLNLTLRVEPQDTPPGTMRTAVMSTPCVVVWMQALQGGVRDFVVSTPDGRVVAQSKALGK